MGHLFYSSRKDGVAHNMLKVAFLELDKYNESRDTELNAHWRQWLEFFWQSPIQSSTRSSDRAGRITPDPIKLDKGGKRND